MTHEKMTIVVGARPERLSRFIVAVSEQHLADVRFGPALRTQGSRRGRSEKCQRLTSRPSCVVSTIRGALQGARSSY